jgi:hypothetical protein
VTIEILRYIIQMENFLDTQKGARSWMHPIRSLFMSGYGGNGYGATGDSAR